MINTSEELEALVDSTVTIPTIPTVLLDIQAVLNNAEGSTAEAAACIQRDQAIAAKVLRLVNSPIYAIKNPITAIPLACSILGLRVVHNLIVQATVLENFGGGAKCEGFDLHWLWDHSFKTAMAARILVRETTSDLDMSIDDAYTGGLIHDVGKIILLQSRPEPFSEALRLSRTQDTPLAVSEGQIFGFSHAHVGGLLAKKWNLAPVLQTAVTFHHSPGTDPKDGAVGFFIKAANTIAHNSTTSNGGYTGDRLDDDAILALGIEPDRLAEITREIAEVTLD